MNIIPLTIAHELERKVTEKLGDHFSLQSYFEYLEEEHGKRIKCSEKPLLVKGFVYECRDAYVIRINSALKKLSTDSFYATIFHEGTHIERKYVPYHDYEYEYIRRNETLILQSRPRDGRYEKLEEDVSESAASLLVARILHPDKTPHQFISLNLRKVFGYKE